MIRGYCDNISYYNFFFLDNDRNLIQCECISCYYFKVTNKTFFVLLESVIFSIKNFKLRIFCTHKTEISIFKRT